jgi:peptidoglycan/xylan/chitin deacetylase (PgdA/CDA1 family)
MSLVRSLFRLPSKLRRRALRSRIDTILVLLAVICISITPFYIIYKPPAFLIRYFQHRWPDVLWHVPTHSKIIALTIDDGPSEYTDEIMQVLKANGATATFFIIGSQVAGREKTLQNLIRNGNELGNHAMNDEPSQSLSDAVLGNQIESVREKLNDAYAAVGVEGPPNYFRPGSGFFSERMCKNLRKLGYRLVLGSIYPHDPQIPIWRVNARHILSMLRPGGIIICHDRRSWTVPMLQKVLPEMRRRGYRVVTVTELLKEGGTL